MSLPTMETLMLLLLLTLISGLFHFLLRRFSRRPANSSDQNDPKNYPFIGCLISFYKNRNRLLDWYTELLAKSPSKTIVINRLGSRTTIVTSNPENVEYILKTNFQNYPKGKPFTDILGDFLGQGIFNVDGSLWMKQRKIASHEFNAKSLKELLMVTLEVEVKNRLLPLLDSMVDDENSEPVDLQELFRKLFFNMICKVSLGVDRFSLDSNSPVSALDKAFQAASGVSAKRGSAPLFLVWKTKKRFGVGSEKRLKEAVQEIHDFVGEIIREKKRKMGEAKIDYNQNQDLLSRLILSEEDEEMVRDMVISFIMAGRDTTSAAMTWFFWLISDHPEIQQEIVEEIRLVKEKMNNFDFESLKEMNFLKACLCETMRLYPPVPWDSKHALTGDSLPDGTKVRTGDRVTYFPYGMGRMEDLWGRDWDEYKPNRWFSEPYHTRVLKEVCPFKFPVFQAGPRVCLGKEMAFVQMKYAVALVLDRFEFLPTGSSKPMFVPLLTAHMAGGLKVLVRRREQSWSKLD